MTGTTTTLQFMPDNCNITCHAVKIFEKNIWKIGYYAGNYTASGIGGGVFHFIEKYLFSVTLYSYIRALQFIIKCNVLHTKLYRLRYPPIFMALNNVYNILKI